jgi:uncharacterized membrane protein (DUF106 family)
MLQIFGEALTKIPNSTFIVIAMALGVNILYAIGRRLLTNVEQMKRIQAELREYQKELQEAILTKNKAKEEKLMKKKPQMDKLQAKLASDNLKVTFLFLIPLMLLWWLVNSIIGAGTVAISPIPIPIPLGANFGPIGPELNIFWWYMISSFAFSGMITKLFGLSLD